MSDLFSETRSTAIFNAIGDVTLHNFDNNRKNIAFMNMNFIHSCPFGHRYGTNDSNSCLCNFQNDRFRSFFSNVLSLFSNAEDEDEVVFGSGFSTSDADDALAAVRRRSCSWTGRGVDIVLFFWSEENITVISIQFLYVYYYYRVYTIIIYYYYLLLLLLYYLLLSKVNDVTEAGIFIFQ